MAASFSHRSREPEIMDDLAFEGQVIFQTLRELDFINRWLGGNAVTQQAVKKVWKKTNKSLVIVDLGCGSGEMLRLIARDAEREKRKTQLVGIDANPHIVAYAQAQSPQFSNIHFEAVNIFSPAFQTQTFDVVIATLFLHHFTDDVLVTLLASLKKQTSQAIIVNDIHRHPLAYYSIRWLTSLFSKSSMVKYDAPLSVMRAFRRNELTAILAKAGIGHYELKWKWAFRWQLIIHLA